MMLTPNVYFRFELGLGLSKSRPSAAAIRAVAKMLKARSKQRRINILRIFDHQSIG